MFEVLSCWWNVNGSYLLLLITIQELIYVEIHNFIDVCLPFRVPVAAYRMPPKEKPLSTSKTEKVGCRVCKEAVSWQSYECHLKRFHPSEDPKDRRAFGEKKLSFNKSRKVEEDKALEDGNENNNEDNDAP